MGRKIGKNTIRVLCQLSKNRYSLSPMYRFWESIIRPICESIDAKNILEIGSWKGDNTKNILAYCKEHNGTTYVIDPAPEYDTTQWKEQWGDTCKFYKGLSLNILPVLDIPDIVLIDGDHNWYTVVNELRILEKKCTNQQFPIVLFHDTGWPYGRRDLYYFPENIPDAFRHPYKEKGLEVGNTELIEDGGINAQLHNSIYEHNVQNGVLTGIEDFLEESKHSLQFLNLPGLHGLGILVPTSTIDTHADLQSLVATLELPDILRHYLEMVEYNRLDLFYQLANHEKKEKDMLEATDQLTVEKGQIAKERNQQIAKNAKLEEEKKDIANICDTLSMNQKELEQEKNILSQQKDGLLQENERTKKEIHHLSQKHIHTNQKLANIQEELKQQKQIHATQVASWEAKQKHMEQREQAILQRLQTERDAASVEKKELSDNLLHVQQSNETLRKNQLTAKQAMSHVQEQFVLHRYTLEKMRFSKSWQWTYGMRQTQRILRAIVNGKSVYLVFGVLRSIWAFLGYPCKQTVRYIRHGILGKLWPVRTPVQLRNSKNDVQKHPPAIDIIIPNFNGLAELQECIQSILECTKYPYRIIILNDCSTDPNVGIYLSEIQCAHPDTIVVLENTTNKGFVYSCNLGILYSGRDVLLLNNDTVVTPHWLGRIIETATLKQDAASIMPLSNNASIYSIDIEDDIAIHGLNTVAAQIHNTSLKSRPTIPTSVGFCMFMRRSAIDAVGIFDPAFGVGYGEENDWCMRASAAGFSHYLDDTAFVYHKGGVSMVEAGHIQKGETTIRAHETLLLKKHPDYTRTIQNYLAENKALDAIKSNIVSQPQEHKKKLSIAYLIHFDPDNSPLGGVELHSKDLVRHVKEEMNVSIIFPIKKGFCVHKYVNGSLVQKKRETRYLYNTAKREKLFGKILQKQAIDVLHVHHTITSDFSMISVAKSLNIPVVWTLHDYYAISPYYNLLTPKQNYYTGIPSNATLCPDSNKMTHEMWRQYTESHLQHVSYIAAPSQVSLDIFTSAFPNLHVPTLVIPHGYTPTSLTNLEPNDEITVCHLGYTHAEHKGRNLVTNISMQLAKRGIRQVFLGASREEHWDITDTTNMTFLGKYTHEDVMEKLRDINPTLVCLLSVWPETFGYTLSEAHAAGLPVYVSNMGALAQRVEHTNTGMIASSLDPNVMTEEIMALLHSEDIQKMRYNASRTRAKTTKEMASEYMNLYRITSIGSLSSYILQQSRHSPDTPLISSLVYDSKKIEHSKKKVSKLSRQPIYSIVIPIHNPEDILLWKTYSSLASQTYTNLEIVFVIDASKESSLQTVVQDIIQSSESIDICKVSSFKQACTMAKGDYIIPIGQHDRLDPCALEQISSSIQEKDILPICIFSHYDHFNINAVTQDQVIVDRQSLFKLDTGASLGLVALERKYLLAHMPSQYIFNSTMLHDIITQLHLTVRDTMQLDACLLHRHDTPSL